MDFYTDNSMERIGINLLSTSTPQLLYNTIVGDHSINRVN